MTRLYMIRHAEAEGNLYRRIQGWYDSLITERGYRQIAALEHRFEDIHIDAVYSSDLFRTRTTAAAIYQPKGLPLQLDPALREIHLGAWEDRSWGDIAWENPESMKAFNASSFTWSVKNGETFKQVGRRVTDTVLKIAAENPDKAIAIFSHGMAIRCLQGTVMGLPVEYWTNLGHGDNTCVTYLEVEGDEVKLHWRNDNTHLPEEISTLAKQTWWKAGSGGKDDRNLRYECLDMEHESEIYYNARKEAWLSIHHTIYDFDGDGFVREALEQWRQDKRAVTCAYLGKELVGLIQMDTLRYAKDGVGYIPFYYMTPEFRKQGLGVQLLGQAISTYRPLGRDRLRLRCAPDNYVAQRFYERYGFSKIGEAEGTRVPLNILEKPIGMEKSQ